MTSLGVSSRGRILLAAGAVGAVALAAATGGELSTRALRATAVVVLLAVVGHAVRQLGASPVCPSATNLTIGSRQALGRDSGVAVVAVTGRRILVGFGPQGVTHLAELTPESEDEPS